MDATHGTNNMCDFKLLTVLIIDEFGEGIPVAWMISNREDTLMIIQFLKAVKERVGPISPKWFMSNDAKQFYSAWRAVFEDNEMKKLLCAWHVGRA